MAEIVMPRLSDTMEEGTILRWLKGTGEQVRRGEELVEIETDKATMTYESDLDGVLDLVAAEGETLPVGAVIAHVGAGAAVSRPDPGTGESASAPVHTAVPLARASAGAPGAPVPTNARRPSEDGVAAAAGQDDGAGADAARVRASPLARRIARERGLDLSAVSGSGPGGRVLKADLPAEGAHAPVPAAMSAAAPTSTTGPGTLADVATAKGVTTTVELTRVQQTIARRMAESKATIPDFSLQLDVDVEACVQLRSELKRISGRDEGSAQLGSPTYNDMVVKACALALREHPEANASYRDGALQLHSRVNVGVAVAAERALIVPTVFDADEKSLGEIARETRTLAERVRSGEITPPELGGATFTVSNLGMFGVRSFAAIINPPQAAILSVGAVAARAVAHEGELALRQMMTLTLVCDHRVLYGADAARFLARVQELLQAPSSLTL